MDSNNTRYFLFRSADEFDQGSRRLVWHDQHQALMLAQNQQLRLPANDPVSAINAWPFAKPVLVDKFGQLARISADNTQIECNSGHGYQTLLDGKLNPVEAPRGEFTDAFISRTNQLVASFSDDADEHGILLFDLQRRWQTHCSTDFIPQRVWLDTNGRAWALGLQQLMLCQGQPLPLPYEPIDERFEPDIVNPDALKQYWHIDLPTDWSALAITGNNDSLYILMHDGVGSQRIGKRTLSDVVNRPFEWFSIEDTMPFAIDIACIDQQRLALLAPKQASDTDFHQRDCAVVQLLSEAAPALGKAVLIEERYPMLSQAAPRFCASADGQLRYQAETDSDFDGFTERPRELHALRQPRYHLEAASLLTHVLDSGSVNTHWHRLYLDAYIPSGCSITVFTRVYESEDQRVDAETIEQPQASWNPMPSELAYQPAFSGYKTNERGIFEILLQRQSGQVRQLRGRYLQLRLQLQGNGKQSPALHAIRVYYPRFSYQEAYLPEVFRQELSVDTNDSEAPANGADFRERLLANFEGMLTPIENRIAASEQLLHPVSAPAEQLFWLGESLGAPVPTHWPEERQRSWIKQAGLVQAHKGTLQGLRLVLNIVSDGGIERGEVVVVENFRLRRTLATILGRNMDDRDHPLTLGTGVSGNSIVGDSLILSDLNAREFFALFAPELASKEENQAAELFFNEYAHRISIMLNGAGRDKRELIEDCLKQHMPAHLQWQLIETDRPFVLGTSPLLQVDTFIEHHQPADNVQLDQTHIGIEDVLSNPAAFSPRDVNAQPETI